MSNRKTSRATYAKAPETEGVYVETPTRAKHQEPSSSRPFFQSIGAS